MLSKKQYQSFVILIFVSLLSLSISNHAQCEPTETKLQVNLKIVSLNNDNSELNNIVGRYFSNAFRAKNFLITNNSNLELEIAVKDVSEKDEIIISLTQSIALPENVINLAAEHEVFYKDISGEKKIPPEGKEIRKMISKEYMYNYRSILENQIIIVKKAELKNICESYVNSFINQRYLYNKKS